MAPFSPMAGRDDEQQIDANWLTDFDRPSFGERIGAKDKVAPTQPTQPAQAVQASQDSQPPAIKFDPQNLPAGIIPSKPTMNQIPPAPVGDKNPNLVGLLGQQAKYGAPLDRKAVDPNTGKPIYRMGWGQRLLGSVANFASGFGGKGPVVYVGPGATNQRYNIDEATRQANLGNVNTQIASQEKLDTENIKQEREAQRQAFETVKGQAALDTSAARKDAAAAQQETADVRKQLADLKSNQGSKIATDAEDRIRLSDQMGLKGNDRRDYILTGKLPKEFQGRQPTELETWMQAFKRDNGRPPTADEIATRKARTRGTPAQFSKVEADKKSGLMKAEKQYREDKLAGDPDAEKNLALAKQLAQETYEQQIQTLGGTVGTSSGKAGQFQVTDPRGVIHTFRDQKSADAFKKAAGIR
jgi:hypothetical protein